MVGTYHEICEGCSFWVQNKPSILPSFHHICVLRKLTFQYMLHIGIHILKKKKQISQDKNNNGVVAGRSLSVRPSSSPPRPRGPAPVAPTSDSHAYGAESYRTHVDVSPATAFTLLRLRRTEDDAYRASGERDDTKHPVVASAAYDAIRADLRILQPALHWRTSSGSSAGRQRRSSNDSRGHADPLGAD